MIRNYFLVAVRSLTRNKFFSAINIFGLAVGMCICMAVIMLVADQMMYDHHITRKDRIYRVNSYGVDQNGMPRGGIENATSPMTIKRELLDKYTGVETAARIKRGFGNNWLSFENQDVNIPVKGYFADPEVIDVFELELEHGDESTALSKPYSVILTKTAAEKLFKEKNPVGLQFEVGDLGTYVVTGVLKETDQKSHLVFEALASMSTVESLAAKGKFQNEMTNWLNFWNGWTYIVVEENKEITDIEPHLEKMYTEHIASVQNPDVYKAKFRFQSLMDITPGPLVNNAIGPSLPWIFVYFLGGLSLVIMLTSCFNFTNLSIARSLKRAKEIGVRKVTGAGRFQIFSQFISESVVVALCALVLAFILLLFLKPLMLQLTFAKVFMWDLEANYVVYAVFVAFAIVVGLLAGIFPAVVLSGFQPVKVLKSLDNLKLFSRMGLRKGLLVTQFTLSLVFIISVIVMYNQLDLFLNKDYGFNMKNNMMIRLNNTSARALKSELTKYNNIESVTGASHIPAGGMTRAEAFKQHLEDKDWTFLNNFFVDEDYLKNMEVELLAGKFFSPGLAESNKNFIVINEESVKTLRYKNFHDAIGQELVYQADSSRKVIIGVIKDYNHNQLMSKIEPLVLMFDPAQISLLQVRYSGSQADASRNIEKAWASVNPNMKVDFKEVEAEIKLFYNTIFGDIVQIVGVIAFLAIMISCLGLLGMATYTIETRMKEISLRKVLGSTDQALVLLLSKSFIALIGVAVVIAVPLAWFINNLWLQFMAYRTELGVGPIGLAVVILLVLAGLTVGSQTIRAAYANPVDNLKND